MWADPLPFISLGSYESLCTRWLKVCTPDAGGWSGQGAWVQGQLSVATVALAVRHTHAHTHALCGTVTTLKLCTDFEACLDACCNVTEKGYVVHSPEGVS